MGETRNAAHYPLPQRNVIATSGFYDNGVVGDFPGTEQMQPSAADIDEPPWRRVSFQVRQMGEVLISRA